MPDVPWWCGFVLFSLGCTPPTLADVRFSGGTEAQRSLLRRDLVRWGDGLASGRLHLTDVVLLEEDVVPRDATRFSDGLAFGGAYSAAHERIWLRRELPTWLLRTVLLHELGHVVDTAVSPERHSDRPWWSGMADGRRHNGPRERFAQAFELGPEVHALLAAVGSVCPTRLAEEIGEVGHAWSPPPRIVDVEQAYAGEVVFRDDVFLLTPEASDGRIVLVLHDVSAGTSRRVAVRPDGAEEVSATAPVTRSAPVRAPDVAPLGGSLATLPDGRLLLRTSLRGGRVLTPEGVVTTDSGRLHELLYTWDPRNGVLTYVDELCADRFSWVPTALVQASDDRVVLVVPGRARARVHTWPPVDGTWSLDLR
jgi:hypothetical protein